MLAGLFAVPCATAQTTPGTQRELGSVVRDGRDRFTLLEQPLQNRQLRAQLDDGRLGGSWGRSLGPLTLASDVSIGTQQTLNGKRQSRFHGFFLADNFLEAQLADGLQANLNLLLLNPSASDGYRASAAAIAGLTLHAQFSAGTIAGRELQLDVYGPDLDWVTLGQGLLIENLPAEGLVGSARCAGVELDTTYFGRALWPDDDLLTAGLSLLDRDLGVRVSRWTFRRLEPGMTVAAGLTDDYFDDLDKETATYLGGFFNFEALKGWRVAGEYARHTGSDPASGLLLRSDWLRPNWGPLSVHVGYQFRWYQRGFGPRPTLLSPLSAFNTPELERSYVTNSHEYFGLSSQFEQASHTALGEASLRLSRWEFFAEGELWHRRAFARASPARVVYGVDGFRAPGSETRVFYHAGVRFRPWSARPHRASAALTNKQAHVGTQVSSLTQERFEEGYYFLARWEVFL